MKNYLALAGAAAALSFLVAPAPTKAQAVFESAYSQPAQMIDDLNVGSHLSFGPRAIITPAAAPTRQVGHGSMRRTMTH